MSKAMTCFFLPSLRSRFSRGQASVEFILLMVVVAVAVTTLFVIFGQPVLDALNNSRGDLVSFIGGTPAGEQPGQNPLTAQVTALPDPWYRGENVDAGPLGGGAGAAGEGGDGADGAPADGAVDTPGTPLADARSPDTPGTDTPGAADAGRTPPGAQDAGGGSPGTGAGTGAEDGGLARGGTSRGGRSGTGTDSDGAGSGSRDEESAEGSLTRARLSAAEDIYYDEATGEWRKRSTGEVVEAPEEIQREGREGQKAKGDRRVSDTTRTLASTEWDWFTVLRIILLILLLVFIFYIGIGAARRNRQNQ